MTTRPKIGLQAIVLGKKYSVNEDRVLDAVAAAGYDALECAVDDPSTFRPKLEARGLVYAGAHTTPAKLRETSEIVATLKAMDASDVCNSGLLDWNKRTPEDYRETIEVLNQTGRELRTHGIHLHYHNHDFEFVAQEAIGGRTGMDLLLEGLDPDAVDLCVDVGWVHKAGLDPVDFLLKHADRVGYLHFKDYDANGWAEIGTGKVDFAPIIGILPRLPGVRWIVLEQDVATIDPLESLRISRANLRGKFGL